MSMESFSYNENGKVPEYVLVQDVLSRALEKEQVIEIVDYDFLGPYDRYGTLQDRVISKAFPLGVDHGLAEISRSPIANKTHRLTLSKIPYENVHKLYLAGYPFGDSSQYDTVISEIAARENDEVEELWDNFNNSNDDDDPMPISPDYYGDDIATINRKSDRWQAEFNAWNERDMRKRERPNREDDRIRNKFQRMRDRAVSEIGIVTRHNISFSTAKANKEEHNTAVVDFNTNITTASLYLPYSPISFEDFQDKTVLQVFLNFLTTEKGSIDKWADYFSSTQSQFPIQPRLSIMSRIQTLGGKIS